MAPELMDKLHRWAERRQAHLVDLQQSGRWRRYYSESEFADLRQEVERTADNWRRLAQPE